MSHMRYALATALLIISGPALATVVPVCAGGFETVYVETLQGADWIDGSAGLRACT